MYIYYGLFPYMGSNKLPLHYYTLLYPQLISIWKELIEYMESMGFKYSIDKHNIEVEVEDKYSNELLAKIHASYMIVEGVYEGEYIDHNTYLHFLWKNYSVEYSNLLLKLADFIRDRDYENAYIIALKALYKVAETENMYAKTGRRINQMLFEMLHGNIPQTYINTYQLIIRKAPISEDIAHQVYISIADVARKTGLMLFKNAELMNKVESMRNSN